MSGALWVKVTTGIWDSDGIKIMRKMPDGDAIMVIWFQLITQAGKCNADGRLQMSDFIPLDAEMLASLFDRPQELVEKALALFARFGMIEYDDDFIFLPNWYKYQSADGLDKVRELAKDRQQKFRDNQKARRNVTNNVTVTEDVTHNRTRIKIKELELQDIKPLSVENPPDDPPSVDPIIPYAEIVGYLNTVCGSNFKASADETKRLIKARWSTGFRVEDFKKVIDNKFDSWGNGPTKFEPKDMRPYLRPNTLFGTKFESYLNEKPPKGGGPRGGGDGGGKQGSASGADYSEFYS